MADICVALDYLHGMLIVHRDVKLSNVLCERAADGSMKVVLADFGLAAHFADASALSRRCGTAGYIAPEVFQKAWASGSFSDREAIPKIDMFSFGAMIYAGIVGRNPFAAESLLSTYRRNSRGLVPLSSVAVRSLSEDLQGLLRKLCAVDPSARCSSSEAAVNSWFYAQPTGLRSDGLDVRERYKKPSWDTFVKVARMCGSSADVLAVE
jgi:serine/threonine protein kinase